MKILVGVVAVGSAVVLGGCGSDATSPTTTSPTDSISSMVSSAQAATSASQAAQDAGGPARRFILESLMQPPDGKFSDVSCDDLEIDPCWPHAVDSFGVSSGSGFLTVTVRVDDQTPLGQATANKASQDIADLLQADPELKKQIIGVRILDRSGKTLAENAVG